MDSVRHTQQLPSLRVAILFCIITGSYLKKGKTHNADFGGRGSIGFFFNQFVEPLEKREKVLERIEEYKITLSRLMFEKLQAHLQVRLKP